MREVEKEDYTIMNRTKKDAGSWIFMILLEREPWKNITERELARFQLNNRT